MKGAFVVNRYYNDKGTEYAFESLSRAFGSVKLEKVSPTLLYDGAKSSVRPKDFEYDFAVFWDKDFYLAAQMERFMPVFNSARTLEICDDKQKTYAALRGITHPRTMSAPLMYDVCDELDSGFLVEVEKNLGFPVIVKENTGSQGRQVHKADTSEQLSALYHRLRHTPHHYQQLVGEFGADLRIYTVGGKAVAACKRQGIDFRSNLGAGGSVSLITPTDDHLRAAEDISRQLNLDFGAVDFLIAGAHGSRQAGEQSGENAAGKATPIFLEVNSNAYFTGIERLGVGIAARIANYILTKLGKTNS